MIDPGQKPSSRNSGEHSTSPSPIADCIRAGSGPDIPAQRPADRVETSLSDFRSCHAPLGRLKDERFPQFCRSLHSAALCCTHDKIGTPTPRFAAPG